MPIEMSREPMPAYDARFNQEEFARMMRELSSPDGVIRSAQRQRERMGLCDR